MYHLSFSSRRPVSADSKSILLFVASLLAEKLSIASLEAESSADLTNRSLSFPSLIKLSRVEFVQSFRLTSSLEERAQ